MNKTNRMPDLVYTPIDGASREPGGYTSANAGSAKPEATVELASETAVRRATVKTADAYPVRGPRTLLTVVGLPSVMALLFVTGRAQAQCNAGLRELSTDPFTNSRRSTAAPLFELILFDGALV